MLFNTKTKRRTYILGMLAAFVSCALYRTDIVFGKKLLQAFSPQLLLFLGTAASTIILFSYLETTHHLKRVFKMPRKELLIMIFASLSSGIVAPLLFLTGLHETSGINASLLANLAPLFVIILAFLILKETFYLKTLAGIIIMLTGVGYIITSGFSHSIDFQDGDIYIVAAAAFFSISPIIFKKYLNHEHVDSLVAFRNFFSAALIGLIILTFAPHEFQTLTELKNLWPYLLGYTVLVVTFSYVLHYWSLERVPAAKSTIISLTGPIIGVFYAWLFLKEAIQVHHFVGGLIIISGLGVINIHLSEKKKLIQSKLKARHWHKM